MEKIPTFTEPTSPKEDFEPTAGIHWNDAQIISYLLTTMPV